MSEKIRIHRRQFIVSVGAVAMGTVGSARRFQSATAQGVPTAFRSNSGSLIPYSRDQLFQVGQQRSFVGDHLTEIAFPLGGIGTGTVSLGGRGELRDWEIFNRPGKGKVLPFTFAALWLKPEGDASQVRVAEAALQPPFGGSFGSARESAQGLPRFRKARFTGAYPFARVDLEDNSVPALVSLEAFNPFVPLQVEASSLPIAIFHYRVASRSQKPMELALAFSILNPVGYDGVADLSSHHFEGFGQNVTKRRREGLGGGAQLVGLEMTSEKYGPDDIRFGSVVLATTHPQVTARTTWEEGGWWDSFQKWLDEFNRGGEFQRDEPAAPTPDGRSQYATLAPRFRLAPGEAKTITFLLAWHFPVRENYWNREEELKGQKLRNDYGTRFANAWEVARYASANLDRLEKSSRVFHDAFFSTDVPSAVLDAVSSQAAILRTNTCLLLEGKQFFAFEGCGDSSGCCPMNCTHVWNYEQALAFLFPELERSMRRTDFLHNLRPDGSMAFRTLLPLERNMQWKFKPAADGQMGCVLKLYREWQISGDDRFLRELWPQAKRALEYAWVHWDEDRDGVMEGEQHNTYDIEFYGPNSMMGTLYLGALLAGERMALAVGDSAAADAYRGLFESGRRKLEELWTGEFYVQKVPPVNQIRSLDKGSQESWHAEAVQNGEVRYQFGSGCLSDQLLGQWFAEVVGLGHLLDPDHVRRTLQSIYRHNFKHSLYDHPNTQRIYALNDEKGLLLCSWPKGGRPALPFVYADEVWTGIEYQVAAHLIYEGLVEEGLAIVKGIRDRYDGARRNPWNEVECGAHYARALASWSVLTALTGFRYSAPDRHLAFSPRIGGKRFQAFFVAGTGWGVFSQNTQSRTPAAKLEIKHGEVRLKRLTLGQGMEHLTVASVRHGESTSVSGWKAESVRQEPLSVEFAKEVVVSADRTLSLLLKPRT
ncbi:MAG: GH116 family glycosyl-hydrolase [Acidobacteriota bacterium]